jgi:hypothetical protein
MNTHEAIQEYRRGLEFGMYAVEDTYGGECPKEAQCCHETLMVQNALYELDKALEALDNHLST